MWHFENVRVLEGLVSHLEEAAFVKQERCGRGERMRRERDACIMDGTGQTECDADDDASECNVENIKMSRM